MSTRFDVQDRNHAIDVLRGFAVLLVILLHVNIRVPFKKTDLGQLLPERIIWAFFTMGYEAVFIFFVISGFLITGNVLRRYGSLGNLDARSFYIGRAGRIVPCLLLLVGTLSLLASLDLPQYRMSGHTATIGGAALAAVGLYMNVYLSFVSPLPPAWDVLWSLSIEEVFYLAFPILCLASRRSPRGAISILAILALALPVVHPDAATTNERWAEKAYWPGISAIAMGAIGSLLAQRYRFGRMSRLFGLSGLAVMAAVLGWEDKLVPIAGAGGVLLMLAAGTAALLVSFSSRPVTRRTVGPFLWLGWMGRRSYEIYLTHMFVVLGAVTLFTRTGASPEDGYLWYLPIVLVCALLGAVVARVVSDPLDRLVRRGFAPTVEAERPG